MTLYTYQQIFKCRADFTNTNCQVQERYQSSLHFHFAPKHYVEPPFRGTDQRITGKVPSINSV